MFTRFNITFFSQRRLFLILGSVVVAASGGALSGRAFANTSLVAATQTPAVMANLSLSIGLTVHATVPAGQVASIQSISSSGTHGSLAKQSATTVVYTPGSYFASLAKGSSAVDKFSYCLTDTSGGSSCNTVSVMIFGTATAATAPASPPAATASYTCLRNFYVSATGSDSAAGATQSTPWRTLQHADNSGLLRAGDCVNLATGIYPISVTQALYHGGSANSTTGYVVYRSTIPHGAQLKMVGSNAGDVIDAYGNYMIFDGFEMDGGNEGLVSNPVTNGSGIIGLGHHFQALNNLVHDFGGEGIGAMFKDWYWIVGNTVYNNSTFNSYQTSGISIYEPAAVSYTATAADASATYHIIIQNNVAHDNAEWHVACATPNCHTDGNGIILDDFQLTQGANPNVPANTIYPYKSLVQGNTVYKNGGRGIHLFQSNNVTVTANIVYGDNLDEVNLNTRGRGELSNANGSNNVWTNNKAAATTLTSGPQIYNAAVVDAMWSGSTTVSWSGNANIDTRTGGKSYQIDSVTRAAGFPVNNPLGSPL